MPQDIQKEIHFSDASLSYTVCYARVYTVQWNDQMVFCFERCVEKKGRPYLKFCQALELTMMLAMENVVHVKDCFQFNNEFCYTTN